MGVERGDVDDSVDDDAVDEGAVDDAVDEGEVGAVGMLPILGENWWAIGLRGAFAIGLGVLIVVWPDVAPDLGPRVLGVMFASYLFVDASLAFVTALVGAEDHRRWWPMMAESVVGVAVAFAIYLSLGTGISALVLLIGGWAIVTGALEIYSAVLLRRLIDAREVRLTVAGTISILFGAVLIALPDPSLSTLTWLIVGYAVFFGVALVALAFHVRNVQRASLAATPT
jgi:uncharacterized membrane protein HdeD (DUF308 family)